jgi:uncharacterized BrkB/YihY/UPF0761 family membrane protein
MPGFSHNVADCIRKMHQASWCFIRSRWQFRRISYKNSDTAGKKIHNVKKIKRPVHKHKYIYFFFVISIVGIIGIIATFKTNNYSGIMYQFGPTFLVVCSIPLLFLFILWMIFKSIWEAHHHQPPKLNDNAKHLKLKRKPKKKDE